MYLWDLGDGRHCWSGWFLSSNLQTLGGYFGCEDGGGAGVFLNEEESKGVLQEKCWRRRRQRYLYPLLEGRNGDLMLYLFGKQRSIWTLVIMIGINFGATNKLLRNLGACVDTVFWHVSRKMISWKKGCRFGRNQNMYRVRVGRWSCSRWTRSIFHEDVDPYVLVISRWELPMSQEDGRKPEFYRDSGDSVVIFYYSLN